MDLEIHPEEALDRALRGELSVMEQRTLEEHLANCRACEAHLALARSALEARAPQPWGDRLNTLAVDNALAHFGRRNWLAWFPAQRRWALATAGIILALGGVASAALWQRQALSPDPIPSPQGAARPAFRTKALPNPVLASAEVLPPLPIQPVDQPAGAPRTPRAQPSAALLFEQASRLRDRNRVDEAIAVFRKLQRLFSNTRESRISFAVTGRLLLDRGRPAEALAQFDQHLARRGEASQEALAGRATALRELGRSSAERETWQKLLVSYPGTVYASQAKARLSQMRRGPEAVSGIEHSR
jgi:tetratricopeptide (TPR) repeat protein